MPLPEQDAVAQRYAMGLPWSRAANASGVAWSTLSGWRRQEEFPEYCEEMRRQVMAAAEPQFAGIIDKAQAILLRVGDDLEPDAKLAIWAERILRATLWPVLVARGLAQSGLTIDGGTALRAAQAAIRSSGELPAGGYSG